MKKIKVKGKLKLNKTTISELNVKDSSNIRGGARKTILLICVKTALDTHCWCSRNGDIRCETKHAVCPDIVTVKTDCK